MALVAALLFLQSVVIVTCAAAVDGVLEINQARALAGNPASGDGPGFPVTITQSGSYRLTSNLVLTSSATTNMIEISADDVTVDLNGFEIRGPVVCGGPGIPCAAIGVPCCSGNGIISTANGQIAIRNGSIRGMGAKGIDIKFAAQIEDMRVSSNGGGGINVCAVLIQGEFAACMVKDSIVLQNGGTGISGSGITVVNNQVMGNHGLGMNLGSATVRDNIIRSNGSHGIFASASVLEGNSITVNGGFGIRFFGGFSGWGHNVLATNTSGPVCGDSSLQTDTNICDAAACSAPPYPACP